MDLKNHPLKEENNLIKEVYIGLLFACAASDGEIKKKEYEFIKDISESVDCNDKYCLERMYRDFNQYVESFKLDFTNNNIIYSFIADAFYLGYLDNDLNEKEISFISKLAQIADLDKKIFEYFYYISELATKENENNYIVAILAKPKGIDFKLFKHLFKKYDKNELLNNKYVKTILKEKKELINLRNLCIDFLNKEHSLADVAEFAGQRLEPVNDISWKLDELTKDIKNDTGESLIISEDDIEWDLVSDLFDLDQTATNLLVEVGQVVIRGKKQTFSVGEKIREIIERFDNIIYYLDDIEHNL